MYKKKYRTLESNASYRLLLRSREPLLPMLMGKKMIPCEKLRVILYIVMNISTTSWIGEIIVEWRN